MVNFACNDKYVFIIINIKCVHSNNISNIYDKLNFTINYIYFTTINIHLLKKKKKIHLLKYLTPDEKIQ